MDKAYLLAIDQGTTNSRAIIFNQSSEIISQHEIPLQQFYPQDGWVEQDALEMFHNSVLCVQNTLNAARITAKEIAAIGITNQRETTIVWNKSTGMPIYPAIVWQDRRTSSLCEKIAQNFTQLITAKTGLLPDPYFSATKLQWILNNVSGAREKAYRGELLFGTVDCFLLWKLTHGKIHATDASNASRTMLYNIQKNCWDHELLDLFDIPASLLPEVKNNADDYGSTHASLFGDPIKIGGMAGDQQAATIGQACFEPGMVKATYGTGCFIVVNTGENIIHSQQNLLSTIAYQFAGKPIYALEGSIFAAGVTVKWLRDTLQLIHNVQETESLAQSVDSTEGVHVIPAFTGLGAPYWDPHARGAILGLTRNSNKAHIVRAALESVAFQSKDLLQAMQKDYQQEFSLLRVDGGMTHNNWLLQFISNILQLRLSRPHTTEVTAQGAAFVAGLQAGVYSSLTDISNHWSAYANYTPTMSQKEAADSYTAWQQAIKKVLTV